MAATTAPKKVRRPKLKLAEMRAQALDARDMQDGVDLELDDGSTVLVPHPLMLSDEQQELLDKFQRDEDLDQEEYTDDAGNKSVRPVRPSTIDGEPAPSAAYRLAAAILPPDEHKRLLAGGGHSNDVQLAWQLITPAQPDPTRQK
jgi:hypothetical protein